VANPRDEVAFTRMARLKPRLGQRLASRVWESLSASGDPHDALTRLDAKGLGLPGAAANSVKNIAELVSRLLKLRSRPGEMVREVVGSGYRDYVRAQLDNASVRLDDLEQLALFADGYDSLDPFLDEVTLMNELSGEDVTVEEGERERVTLSTIHQAKGLEWRAVFIVWLAEGRFPTARAEDMEEERRLFYVACTRAKDELILCYPLVARDRYRVDVILEPSRFVTELPDNSYQRWQVQEGEPQQELPEGGRYELPGFFGDGGDDVN
jgi:DNA helicase-2/ATP-dependent DNA helicase PcrA